MDLPEIDFHSIRPHQGSQANGFEELCCQLAALEDRATQAEHHRKGAGADGGVECFTRHPDGTETGWQAKFYWQMSFNLKQALDDSIQTALQKHPDLTSYIVCLPFDPSDARTGQGDTPLEQWRQWRDKWIHHAEEQGRKLSIERWGASELGSKLIQDDPRYTGRVLYWFNQQVLTSAWFDQVFEKAKADLDSRYTPETNVQLSIRKILSAFARNPELLREIEDWARSIAESGRDALRDGRALASRSEASPMPDGLEPALRALDEALSVLPESAADSFPLARWQAEIAKAIDAAENTLEWAQGQTLTMRDWSGVRPDEMAQRSLWKLCHLLEQFKNELQGERWGLVNARQVLIYGEGGSGKSHLLADAAAHQLERDRPAVLLLGQRFVLGEPWRQILEELDLPRDITANQFLGAMDAAAQAAGTRGLLMIDALNERFGPQLWPDRLTGFLRDVERFPHLGVILSCRSTYLEYVIPDALDEQHLPHLEHHGFRTVDAQSYLAMRGFVLPGAPTLTPEFENPLFLKTCCDALEKQGQREIPRGIRGTSSIYEFYEQAVARSVDDRLQLNPRHKHVQQAVNSLAETMAQRQEETLPLGEVQELFEQILPSNGLRDRDLLTQLENEGLLTVEAVAASGRPFDEVYETVRFTFQRISDYAIANHLLISYVDLHNPHAAFAEDGPLYTYTEAPLLWRMAGVVEALAIQLPERANVELPDVLPGPKRFSVAHAFENSLLWRDQHCFTTRTLELVKKFWGEEQLLSTLLRIATEPDNQFNAQYLHTQLSSLDMPHRDQWWSAALAVEDLEPHEPVATLIDWAWQTGFGTIDDDRAELAGITLTWFLTTSHRAIRDRATKALVALLTPRPRLAQRLLACFWPIDDDYLRERLMAALYGAVMQGDFTDEDLQALAQTVYTTMFEEGQPPPNVLLRDHGRGVIEYAVTQDCVPASITLHNVRPPYDSEWPLDTVPSETIEGYKETGRHGRGVRDEIVQSCIDGDFARYVIHSHARRWSPAPIGTMTLPTNVDLRQQWIEEFEASASQEALDAFEQLKLCSEALRQKNERTNTQETRDLHEAEQALQSLLTLEQWQGYCSRVKGWLHYGMVEYGIDPAATCDPVWTCRWVCKRAHDLGWSEELHGTFDKHPVISLDRMEHRVERIGKKYQWLAMYKLLAHLADHCAKIGNFVSEAAPAEYIGEWEGGLRHIDPSLLVSQTFDDGWTIYHEPTWWAPVMPQLRPMEPRDRLQWLYTDSAVIDDPAWIEVSDPQEQRWLTLHNFVVVRQGDRSGGGALSESWARLDCVVVPSQERENFIQGLRETILADPHTIPRPDFYGHDLYLGEYAWHPAFKDWEEWTDFDDPMSPLPVSCCPTVRQYTCEQGGYDYSPNQTVHLQVPAMWLMDALSLRLADGRSARFVDDNRTTRFFDPSLWQEGPKAGLVDRGAFLGALEQNDLAAVWIIAGEKNVYGHRDSHGFGGRYRFTTLYWQGDNQWQRQDHYDFIPPTADQVEAVLGFEPPSWVHTRA